MTEINFTSTYRIPITQAGVNAAKKAKLKELIQSYPNGLIGNSKVGNARVSMPDSEDARFIQKLKTIGYKVFQKFEGENIPKEEMDVYIKERLDNRNYNQIGKKMKRMSREMKEKRKFDNSFDAPPKVVKKEEAVEEIQPIQTNKEPVKVAKKNSAKEVDQKASMERIKQTPGYIKCKEQYGEEFANAVFFDIR